MHDFLLLVQRRTQATILLVTHDIEEALCLADRIYVLSSRPGRVETVIDVPFGKTRNWSITRDPRYLDLRDEIQDLLSGQ
jgi:NitT/TauT family transport system ATP-binding protein